MPAPDRARHPRDPHDSDEQRRGDKVRIRSGPWSGARGVVVGGHGHTVEVELPAGDRLSVAASDLTNYSRAARRAWQVMPKRAGRPRASGTQKRMVSVRLDVDVWRLLAQAAEMGLIPSREQAVNAWLREKAKALLAAAPPLVDTLSAAELARLRGGVEPDGDTESEERTKNG